MMRSALSRHYHLIGFGLLGAVCGLFIVVGWAKLDSLWGDPNRWMFEMYRAANGEVVYRDFAWQFPPLALLLFSGAYRLFGSTYEVTQIILDVLCAGVVFLTWAVARRLLSRWLALATAIALACAMATGGAPDLYFFSLEIYGPALLTGMIGILWLLLVLIDYWQTGVMTTARWLGLSIGATIALLSKPEFAVGTLAGLAALLILDRRVWFRDKPIGLWLRRGLSIALLGVGPALIGYLLIGSLVGFDNLVNGILGYGVGSLVCPWWPTGISAFGVLVALGQGALFIALVSLMRFNVLRRTYAWRYFWLWIVSALGSLLSILYLPLLLGQGDFSRITLDDLKNLIIDLGTVLLPVMWLSILLWLRSSLHWLRTWRRHEPPADRSGLWLLIWTIAIAMSARGLFGDAYSITTMVAVAPLPIWLIVWPYLMLKILQRFKLPDPDQGAALWSGVVLAVVILYGAVRLSDGLLKGSRIVYTPLQTEAGVVRLKDRVSARVYAYVLTHTADHENILDVAYGGGINFAARRGSPIYSTQFWYMLPPQKYVDADFERISRDPPALVLGNDLENFGATFGVIALTRCTFPRLVWRPDEYAYDPTRSFPTIEYIQAHYQPVADFGGIVILERLGSG